MPIDIGREGGHMLDIPDSAQAQSGNPVSSEWMCVELRHLPKVNVSRDSLLFGYWRMRD